MHYSFACAASRRALAQDWILMNLISHLLKARNALSGINESLWVSFGRFAARTSGRHAACAFG